MSADKNAFARLGKFLGYKINEDDIVEMEQNQYDMAKPDNWADMSEEEQAKWKKEHMVKNEKTPEPEPKKPTPIKANQDDGPEDDKPEDDKPLTPENLMQLNSLIEEMGGFEAFKGLLYGSVQAVEVMQNQEKQERKNVIAQLVANSAGTLTEADLKDLDLAALNVMSKAIVPQHISYAGLGGQSFQANEKDNFAVMPDIFAAETWKE